MYLMVSFNLVSNVLEVMKNALDWPLEFSVFLFQLINFPLSLFINK